MRSKREGTTRHLATLEPLSVAKSFRLRRRKAKKKMRLIHYTKTTMQVTPITRRNVLEAVVSDAVDEGTTRYFATPGPLFMAKFFKESEASRREVDSSSEAGARKVRKVRRRLLNDTSLLRA
jgi:hypothetical protein